MVGNKRDRIVPTEKAAIDSKLLTILFALSILLAPFQNTELQLTSLRYLGASLSFLPLVLFCLVSFGLKLKNGRLGRAESGVLIFLLYSSALSAWGVLTVDAGNIAPEFLVRKTVTNSILNILLVYPIFVMPSVNKTLRLAIYASLFIATAGFLFVDVLHVGGLAYPSFFQTTYGVTFPRGFSFEQSSFAATICTLALVAAAVTGKFSLRVAFTVTALVFVVFITNSKGTTLALVAAFGLAYLVLKEGSIFLKLAGVLFAVVLGFFVSAQMTERFSTDIERSSSTSTRSILIMSSVPSVLANPLGVGYSGYIPSIIKYVYPSAEWLQKYVLPRVKLQEIESYISRESKEALNIKAQFFEYLMVFGIPGLILLISFHRRLYKKISQIPTSRQASFFLLFWFLIISMLTYMPALGLYFYTVAYGVLLKCDAVCAVETRPKKQSPPANFVR